MVKYPARIAVVGCGSIGQRHIRNLCALRGVREIVICTKRHDAEKLISPGNKKITVVRELSRVDTPAAIVCTESSRHVGCALSLVEKGIDCLVEKPLSHTLAGTAALTHAVARRKVRVILGYNFRFLKALQSVRAMIARRRIGKVYFGRIEVGQFLPEWRARDYRSCYSARKRMGGGVGLDLSHEIDYMRFLFGSPLSWKVFTGKVSALEIDSDDVFEAIFLFPGGATCSVHMDYLQREKTRLVRIVGSRGSITCDIIRKRLTLTDAQGREHELGKPGWFDVNETYVEELNFFLSGGRGYPAADIADGVFALRCMRDGHV